MGGSTPTLTLMALLCLGLCQGPRDQVQAGTLPKPAIWADPGPVVPVGSPVTIWCQGSQQAQDYYLHREGGSRTKMKRPQNFRNRVSFLIESMDARWEGSYWCHYRSRHDSSMGSNYLVLKVTGAYPAPSLSAQPSPVVASGGTVTLACSSQGTSGTFYLLKEGGADPPQPKSGSRYLQGRHQALFPLGPSSPSHGGTYRCYHNSYSYPDLWSASSAPLRLQVTGAYGEPSLSAQPGPLVPSGHSLTLRCGSGAGFGSFALTKDEGRTGPQRLDGQHSPDFPLGPVARTHGGQYRCYGGHNLSHVWSAPSAPLDILIAGMDPKPSLSAQPGPTVSPGENVTLQCRSDARSDTFYLSKEGSPASPQRLRLQDTAAPSQALFTFRAVTSAHGGTYRCYSSHSASPFLLSHPSDPLRLQVSGEEPPPACGSWLSHHLTGAQGLNGWYLKVLTGVLVVASLLLLSLLLLLRQQCQGEHRKSGQWGEFCSDFCKAMAGGRGLYFLSSAVSTQSDSDFQLPTEAAASTPKDRGLQDSSGPAAGIQEENLYAVVQDPPPETRQLDPQAAAPEGPQEITYAQLNYLILTQETSSLPSPSELPGHGSVYAALDAH
ncbi:leukocyte immunoglobulin-like receptor subfamily A member 3 [Talpa occidentalis]|uniref:leukocyte immunoglobulin-like receptor subfamily A member 3 n=1 Tax=Talpa occidentalis TaxID=50954 RepID=UPI0023F6ED8D|nr:leukocyte immunoglobulin-like receptor subfamily A member 3 [Talpa occidentalis]